MMNYLERYFIRRYVARNREITKIAPSLELGMYLFKTPDDIVKILKGISTAGTLRYYEAKTDEERWIAKGMIMLSKLIRELHQASLSIAEIQDDKKKEEMWSKMRKVKKI